MPARKTAKTPAKTTKKPKTTSKTPLAKLDVIFSGPLLFVPEVSAGFVSGVEVLSPRNGHPIGALFVPGVFFTDAELNDPQCARWPEPADFSLLDPHSYAIEITQQLAASQPKFPASGIPDSNHKIKPGRRLSDDWEVAISVTGQMDSWGSQRIFRVTDDLYTGADAPSTPTTAAMHRLTYTDVTGAEFYGISTAPREYLRANIAQGGSLIILGEIPYQSTLSHERRAIESLAKLAGLDLHLAATDPNPHKARLMYHAADCGHSIVLV